MYAVIDIETTGGKFNQEHIMEIAVFLFDGKEVIDQFITLVNPEAPIQKYVTKMTGITENMVKRSPKFYEIAKRIVKITEDAVFVAHNVKFDYRVVQLEFERLGFDFHRKTLDTIDLTKELIPGLKTYGLESVCKELGITNTHRHRADGDARATVELLKILLEKDAKKLISKRASSIEESQNQHPFREIVRTLKNVTGVYYLHNAQGDVIYIGRSSDMQNSINRHFLATNQLALSLQKEATNITIEETGNEAVAQIKALSELRRLKPKYNSGIKTKFLPIGLFATQTDKGITFLRVMPVRNKLPDAYFRKPEIAYACLENILVKNQGNPEALLLEKDFEALEKNLAAKNFKKTKKVLPKLAVQKALFKSAHFVAIGPGRNPNQRCLFYIKNYRVRGYAYFSLDVFLEDEAMIKKHLVDLKPHAFTDSIVHYFLSTGTFKAQDLGAETQSKKK